MRALLITTLALYINFLTPSLYAKAIETEDIFIPSRQALKNKNGESRHLSGVGRLADNCTATLIDTRYRHEATAQPAYLVTAGHCVSSNQKRIITDKIIANKVMDFRIEFNYFGDTIDQIKTYTLKKINWSSVRGIDLAVIELEASLTELIDAGIQPLSIGSRPEPGSAIAIIGAPGEDFLHQSFCTLAPTKDGYINNDGESRILLNSLNAQCRRIGRGASGGPIVERETGKVVGVLYGAIGESDVYGSAIQPLQGCFTSGQFDPSITRCSLFPVYDIDAIVPQRRQNFLPAKPELGLEAVIPSWDLKFSISTPFYRYKTEHSLSAPCESPHDYSEAISADNAYIDKVIGTKSGRHWLCIIGVETPEQPPFHGIMKNNQTMRVDLRDHGNEPLEVDIATERENFSEPVVYNLFASAYFSPPTYAQIYSKTGPASETDCDDPQGYEEMYRRARESWVLLASWNSTQEEAKLCVYSKNARGESSRPMEHWLKVADDWKN
ncbi:trypsin-like peptidase domain-containing protein [Pseudomonas gingeri]|uniref:trypsin-like serine peptidase n=1 Tax=Pseudomonas gingeri TaxID=117681 RepID=UPI0015A4D00A|nr:serine protease [Pseudomonas gingeri]NWA24281.1 trypsin-like peptidase domain-containing protein [Pseudomonas gingeri]